MGRIYVVQHAEKVSGAGDPALSVLGRQQATVTGRWLNSAAVASVYSSPLLRVRQTAERIASAAGWPGTTVLPSGRVGFRRS